MQQREAEQLTLHGCFLTPSFSYSHCNSTEQQWNCAFELREEPKWEHSTYGNAICSMKGVSTFQDQLFCRKMCIWLKKKNLKWWAIWPASTISFRWTTECRVNIIGIAVLTDIYP